MSTPYRSSQHSFSTGEIDPSIQGQVDSEVYRFGSQRLENFLVTPPGSILRRQGTRHLAKAISYTSNTLRSVRFSDGKEYLLWFWEHPDSLICKLSIFEAKESPIKLEELTVPYFSGFKLASQGDIVYFAHPDHPLQELRRLGPTTWSWSETELYDGPYQSPRTDMIWRSIHPRLFDNFDFREVVLESSDPNEFADLPDLTSFTSFSDWDARDTGSSPYSVRYTDYEIGGARGFMQISQKISNSKVSGYPITSVVDVRDLSSPVHYGRYIFTSSGARADQIYSGERVFSKFLEGSYIYVDSFNPLQDPANPGFPLPNYDPTGWWELKRYSGVREVYFDYYPQLDADPQTPNDTFSLVQVDIFYSGASVYRSWPSASNLAYSSDFSVNVNGWESNADWNTLVSASASVGGESNALELESTSVNALRVARQGFAFSNESKIRIKFDYFVPEDNTVGAAQIYVRADALTSSGDFGALALNVPEKGVWATYDSLFTSTKEVFQNIIIIGQSIPTGSNTFGGSAAGDKLYIKNLTVEDRVPMDNVDGISRRLYKSMSDYNGSVRVTSTRQTTYLRSSVPHNLTSSSLDRVIRVDFSGKPYWGKIDEIIDGSTIRVTSSMFLPLDSKRITEIANLGESTSFQLGAFYQGNYASVVGFYQQRMILASTNEEVQTFWGSTTGDFTRFSPTELDGEITLASGFGYTLASGKVSPITFISTYGTLVFGTSDGSWVVRSSNFSDPISSVNIRLSPETTQGSLDAPIHHMGHSIFFISHDGRKLCDMHYRQQIESYQSVNLNAMARHLTREERFVQFEIYRDDFVFVRSDLGNVFCLTRDIDVFGTMAWSRQNLGHVLDMAVGGDSIYFFIDNDKTPGLSSGVSLERMSLDYPAEYFVDHGKVFDLEDSSQSVPVTAFDYMEPGTNVAVWANGNVHSNGYDGLCVVGSTGFVSNLPAVRPMLLHIGIPYRSYVKTTPNFVDSDGGSVEGRIKRIQRINFKFVESMGLYAGTDPDRLTYYPASHLPNLFTGLYSTEFSFDYERDISLIFQEDNPVPCELSGFILELTHH